MEESISFQSILIIFILAFVTPIIINSIKRFKIPFVVGEIFVGLIVGKSFLNIVHDDIWIVFLSNLGLAFLMFLSGLEIDFSQFKVDSKVKLKDNNTLKQLIICLCMLIISLCISYILSYYLVKLGIIDNIYFCTFLLTSTAPGLLVPLLKERKFLNSNYGQTLLIFSLLCEFICLISMTMLSSTIYSGLSYKSFLFIIVILISVFIYILAKKALNRFTFKGENFNGLHLEVRAAFMLMLILVSLSHALHTEIVMGAFLAGVIFSIISGNKRDDLKDKLDIIGYGVLIPIFFIQVGVNLNITSIFAEPNLLFLIPVLLIYFYIAKAVSALLLHLLFGFNKAISASFILSTQLSLMIVGCQMAYNIKIITDASYSLFIVSTIISCFVFPILFDKFFKYDDIIINPSSVKDKICIRQEVLTNPSLFDKELKEVKFPSQCRVFMILRDSDEILPTGETVLRKGDVLLLAGIKSHENEMIELISDINT